MALEFLATDAALVLFLLSVYKVKNIGSGKCHYYHWYFGACENKKLNVSKSLFSPFCVRMVQKFSKVNIQILFALYLNADQVIWKNRRGSSTYTLYVIIKIWSRWTIIDKIKIMYNLQKCYTLTQKVEKVFVSDPGFQTERKDKKIPLHWLF